MQKEDFEPVNQGKLSELIFRGSYRGKDNELYNMFLPMSSAMFKRVFPKAVRGTFFHVTSPEGFENLYEYLENKIGVDIRGSFDKTGNPNYGGNWVLETHSVNIKNLYFKR